MIVSPGLIVTTVEEELLGVPEETPADTWNRNTVTKVTGLTDKYEDITFFCNIAGWFFLCVLQKAAISYICILMNYSSQKSFPFKRLTEAFISGIKANSLTATAAVAKDASLRHPMLIALKLQNSGFLVTYLGRLYFSLIACSWQ